MYDSSAFYVNIWIVLLRSKLCITAEYHKHIINFSFSFIINETHPETLEILPLSVLFFPFKLQ